MNLFDKILDSDGTLSFERIRDYDSKKLPDYKTL